MASKNLVQILRGADRSRMEATTAKVTFGDLSMAKELGSAMSPRQIYHSNATGFPIFESRVSVNITASLEKSQLLFMT
jgi:hypothetical protein